MRNGPQGPDPKESKTTNGPTTVRILRTVQVLYWYDIVPGLYQPLLVPVVVLYWYRYDSHSTPILVAFICVILPTLLQQTKKMADEQEPQEVKGPAVQAKKKKGVSIVLLLFSDFSFRFN